jgi:hypothetical protein
LLQSRFPLALFLRATEPSGASQELAPVQNRRFAKLFALGAGVHVDFHTNRHFNDLRCFPGHESFPIVTRCSVDVVIAQPDAK